MPKICYINIWIHYLQKGGLFESPPSAAESSQVSTVHLSPGPIYTGCLGIASLTSEASWEMGQEQISNCFHLRHILRRDLLLWCTISVSSSPVDLVLTFWES